ncbi:MAG TPA: aminotransferase class I/II-fold pyridoxal phosphate-dependent enzyme [Pseudolabrys sp.]|nr:aminotransferase class I/II-fold pyridoxal phosphate-dependent enzyme [Pseudolabrys sp.]
MQIPVLLDRSRRESLTDQLIEQLRDAIRQARIAPGTRLPSSRRLAEQLAVSRNTVIRAYDTLIVDGYVQARPASGIFVADQMPGAPPIPATSASEQPEGRPLTHMPMPPLPLRAPHGGRAHQGRLSFDFYPGRPNAALFPLKIWRRLLQSNLSHGGSAGLTGYGEAAGLPALRSAIANHLAATRGIAADPSRIIIVAGAQEGISIAARLFLNHAALAAIEDPCFEGAAFAFEATGAELYSVPVDFEGLIPEELPQRPTTLLYVTPSHQYPTGHTLALARRRAVIAWARRCGCYILEDDRDSDFRYEGSTLPAIAALAPDCTIYLGSFSRTLGAGLRLGYMVVPEQLAGIVTTAKALLDSGNPWLDQAALAEMMRSNSYAAHLARARAHYKESRDVLLDALRRNFGDVSVTGESGGLQFMWYLPPGVPDAGVVENLARRARIGVYSLGSAGAHVARLSPLTQRGLMLGYGALSHKQIEQGIALLSDAVDDAVDDQKVDVSKLFARTALPLAALSSGTGSHLDSKFRRRPALAARRRQRASSARGTARDASKGTGGGMISVSKIYRYPIKGLSAQPLSQIALEAGKPFPQDRIFALARPGAPIDAEDPKWAKKGLFAMLMLDEGLATVSTHLDLDSEWLTVRQGNAQVAGAKLTDEAGRAEIEQFFWKLLPSLPSPPVLVRSRHGHFMDKPDSVISLINLATVRSLEQQWGYEIDPLRFRANIYIDGGRPWEEFDWVGGDVRIGDTVFAVDRKNGRCGATNVNPASGRRDLDIPGSLRAAFGHKNLGVYLMVREGGSIAVGDRVDSPVSAHTMNGAPTPAFQVAERSFICRGCYFVYEEAKGLPQQSIRPGTRFADIPANWRCPDCGTEKTTFRPYVQKAATAS